MTVGVLNPRERNEMSPFDSRRNLSVNVNFIVYKSLRTVGFTIPHLHCLDLHVSSNRANMLFSTDQVLDVAVNAVLTKGCAHLTPDVLFGTDGQH